MHLTMKVSGHGLDLFASRAMGLAQNGRALMAEGLNAGGSGLRKLTVAAETAQTGLRHGIIDRAQAPQQASAGFLVYSIHTHGGNTRLKFFGARETQAGVVAHPWNSTRTYAGSFMRGGHFPARVQLNMGSSVLKRAGKGRLPLRTVKSGLFVPVELTKGRTAAAFNAGMAGVSGAVIGSLAAAMP